MNHYMQVWSSQRCSMKVLWATDWSFMWIYVQGKPFQYVLYRAKDIMIRSTAIDVCTKRLILKEKFGDQVGILRIQPSCTRPSRVLAVSSNGFSPAEPWRRVEAQAILSPVSDPSPTTSEKVRGQILIILMFLWSTYKFGKFCIDYFSMRSLSDVN